MENVLELRGLTKQFKSLRAVDGLDLELAPGSVFGFLGVNGAGKTTTLRMVTNLARPTSGEIIICGKKAVFGSNATNRSIGYLPDVPQFYDWMKPEEYLVMSGRLMGMNKPDAIKRARELLGTVGLADAKRNIKGFSRGMKQRLGIAQALMHDPKLLLMDEPTSALDPIGRKEMLDIIQALGGSRAVLFSTHILSDVERVCDRVGILHRGKLALAGSLEDISARYASKGAALETGDASRHAELLEKLKAAPWARGVKSETPGNYTVRSSDPERMDREICALLAAMGVPLRRYERLEATLEDVFVEVIGQ